MSRSGATLGVLAGLLLALVPLVDAQIPSTPSTQTYQIVVTASPASVDPIRKVGGALTIKFTIGFQCLKSPGSYGICTGSQGDQEMEVTYPEPVVPAGWRLDKTAASKDSGMRIAARATAVIEYTVTLLKDDPAKDAFDLAFDATGKPYFEGGVIDLLPPQAAQSSHQGAKVYFQKITNPAEEVTSVLRDYMWPLLGGAAILLLAGIILRERRHHRAAAGTVTAGRLQLECDARTQSVEAGRGASFPVRIHNEAGHDDKVTLQVLDLPSGWASILPLSHLELPAGQRTELWVTVRAPPDAMPGQRVPFQLTAKAEKSSGEARLPLEASVVPGRGPTEAAGWSQLPEPPPPTSSWAPAPAEGRRKSSKKDA